ncbi:MAG: hypothetical protein AAFR11_04915 [Pseudomonadota bacterium]
MGALTGLVVSVAAISGVVALVRAVERRASRAREAFDRSRGEGRVIDYERDPSSGVFRPKS